MKFVHGKRLRCVNLGMAMGHFTMGKEYYISFPLLVEHPDLASLGPTSGGNFCTVEDNNGRRTLFTEGAINHFFQEIE